MKFHKIFSLAFLCLLVFAIAMLTFINVNLYHGNQRNANDIITYVEMRAILSAIMAFQKSKAYEDISNNNQLPFLLFDEHQDRSLFKLLTDFGNSPYGGPLLEGIPNDRTINEVWVNKWGNPYRVMIFSTQSASGEAYYKKANIPLGRDGSFIFVFSKTGEGQPMLLMPADGMLFAVSDLPTSLIDR